MSSASASSSLSMSSFARATTLSRSAFGPVSFATSAGTSSEASSAAIFASTSRAASRSVGVSWAAATVERRIIAATNARHFVEKDMRRL